MIKADTPEGEDERQWERLALKIMKTPHGGAFTYDSTREWMELPDKQEPYEKLGQFLKTIGWRDTGDAQWESLKASIPQICSIISEA